MPVRSVLGHAQPAAHHPPRLTPGSAYASPSTAHHSSISTNSNILQHQQDTALPVRLHRHLLLVQAQGSLLHMMHLAA